MAFSGVIRKASSRQIAQFLNATMFGFERTLRNFSSGVADSKDLVDAKLYKALKSEYNLSKIMLKHSQVNLPIGSFPFKVKYISLGGGIHGRQFGLIRKFPNGEKVFLRISIDDKYDKKVTTRSITVDVGKGGEWWESDLQFEINASTENIVIESIYCKDELKFEDIDNEFQQALIEYLNIRGVNRDAVTFLSDFIANENKKADLLALKHFKKVVKT